MQGQYEIARLSSDAVARAVALSTGAGSLARRRRGHGEFSMALCRRHDGLRATIVDQPAAPARAATSSRPPGNERPRDPPRGRHVRDRLGGPHDGALAFNINHHLPPEQIRPSSPASPRPAARRSALCPGPLRPPGRAAPQRRQLPGPLLPPDIGCRHVRHREVSEWLRSSGSPSRRSGACRSSPPGPAPGGEALAGSEQVGAGVAAAWTRGGTRACARARWRVAMASSGAPIAVASQSDSATWTRARARGRRRRPATRARRGRTRRAQPRGTPRRAASGPETRWA